MQTTDRGECFVLRAPQRIILICPLKGLFGDFESFLCPPQQRGRGSRLNIIIVAEGAMDRSGKPISCDLIKQVSKDSTPT